MIEVLALTREGWDTCASLKDGGRGSPAEKIYSGTSIYMSSSQFSGSQVFRDQHPDLGITDLSQLSIQISRNLYNSI